MADKKKKTQYKIAKEDLYLSGRKVYRAGDRVPVSLAKRHGWEDKLVGENTKTAKRIHDESDEERETRVILMNPRETDEWTDMKEKED